MNLRLALGGLLLFFIVRAAVAAEVFPSSEILHLKQGVVADLADPASVQFRELFESTPEGARSLCGELNAKNLLGAYTGFRRFYVAVANGEGKSTEMYQIEGEPVFFVFDHSQRSRPPNAKSIVEFASSFKGACSTAVNKIP